MTKITSRKVNEATKIHVRIRTLGTVWYVPQIHVSYLEMVGYMIFTNCEPHLLYTIWEAQFSPNRYTII